MARSAEGQLTPRQACPRPKRPRAQLAFKNSMVHGILQFTPSIAFCYVLHRCVSRDIRCRESFLITKRPQPACTPRTGQDKTSPSHFCFPWHIPCRGLLNPNMTCMEPQTELHTRMQGGDGDKDQGPYPHHRVVFTCSQVVLPCRFDNDPSAGSPTETLLRLLLPLNDKVQWNSRDVAGGEPPTSPRS